MQLKHNYKGNRGDISQPKYINYCFFKCVLSVAKLKKQMILNGSTARGLHSRVVKHLRIDQNKIRRFTKKRLYWGRNQKYRLKKWNDNYRKNNKIN